MICQDDQRRAHVRAHQGKQGYPDLNGLDYVEVVNENGQTTLAAYFIGKLPMQLSVDRQSLSDYLRIEGGRRVRDIRVVDVDPHVEEDPELDDYLIVYVEKSPGRSTYRIK